jgi:tryptophanyl-tRNA synthetase
MTMRFIGEGLEEGRECSGAPPYNPQPACSARLLPTMTLRVLTGITTTGTPHLGNYVGAIRPAIAASREPGVESFFFLADYHALIKCDEPERIERSRLQIAATWLAAGLDPQRVTFYRQSDVPETPELAWLLTCVASKGLMNRAHAYKAAVEANAAGGDDPDANIGMGLYSYPILMAADILLFNAHRVPVGADQRQHIEITRDLAARFNHLFGRGEQLLVLPEAQIDDAMALLPGLDGRKMSKSYDNVIPLFEGGAAGLKDAVARIVTDSRAPGEPKDPDGSALVTIHDAFATAGEREQLRADLRAGLAWGEAKARLVQRIEAQIGPLRAEYERLIAHPQEIEAVLQAGAAKARALARPLMARLRDAVGLRPMQAPRPTRAPAPAQAALPLFKQYREADGRFYFKLSAADGSVLLVSEGFSDAREAGAWVKRLRSEGGAALARAPIAWSASGSRRDAEAALDALAAQ